MDSHDVPETVQTAPRTRGRWAALLLGLLILLACAGLGVGVYALLGWMAAQEGPPQFVEPEAIPAPGAMPERSATRPLRPDQLTATIDISSPAPGRWRGIRLRDVDIALVAWSAMDAAKLPPVEDLSAAYVGVTIAAVSRLEADVLADGEEPVSIDSLTIEVVSPSKAEEVYLPEFVEVAPGHREIPTDGTPLTFRVVFILPRASDYLGLRVGVWGADGQFDRAVLPNRPVPAAPGNDGAEDE